MIKNHIKKPQIAPIIIASFVAVIVGVLFYCNVENLSIVDSFFFSMNILTTLGYADFVPQTDLGKIFTNLYALFGIVIIASGANYILRHALDINHRKK